MGLYYFTATVMIPTGIATITLLLLLLSADLGTWAGLGDRQSSLEDKE